MHLFFLFFLPFTMSAANVKYICTLNHTVVMEADTVVFFESPNFPRHMTSVERDQCFITFMKDSFSEEENKRFVIVTSNAHCEDKLEGYDGCRNLYDSSLNAASYNFHLNNNIDIFAYSAFQGFAYFDDWGDDCPLESISRVNPFHFTDINQTLVLRSTYDASKVRNQSCLWHFKAPENFGFKIVIIDLNILNTTFFKVENVQDTIISASNVRVGYPHYSIDNYLKIYISENNDPYIPIDKYGQILFEFTAYVTIIQNFFHDTPLNCSTTISTNSDLKTIWWYWNADGYPSNARCTYTMTIQPKTEVIATLVAFEGESFDGEEYSDMINYYYNNNSLPNIYGPINSGAIVFSADDAREILWEFISDGSIQYRGFIMSYEPKSCNCAHRSVIHVPCTGGTEIYIMDGAGEYYCGNLECNFTIKLTPSCSSDFITLSLTFNTNQYHNEAYENDVFKFISDNITMFEIKHSAVDTSYRFRISPAHDNIFQAITASSTYIRGLTLEFDAFNISTILSPVIINEKKPYYFLEACAMYGGFYMLSIELSQSLKERNATLEIFTFDKRNVEAFTFYNKHNLTDQLNFRNCFIEITDSVYMCKTNLNSVLMAVVIYAFPCHYNLLFQVRDGENLIGSEGCVFKKNNAFNFVSNYNGGEVVFSAVSNGKKNCRIFCYSFDYVFIRKIWTSSNSSASIKIVSGTEEKIFAIIDISSIFLWRNLFFSKNIYIIDIPVNTSMIITADYDISKGYNLGAVNITNNPYKTIIISPYYGSSATISYPNYQGCHGDARYFEIFETVVQFTVLNFDVLEPNYFYFAVNKTQYFNITSIHHSFTFGPSHIEFGCYCFSNLHCNTRILLETVVLNESITLPMINTTTLSTTMQLQTTTEKSLTSKITTNYLLMFVIGLFMLQLNCDYF